MKTIISTKITKPVEFKLKRAGCPVDKIPRFTVNRTYECSEPDEAIYHLPDGTKCCRKATSVKACKKIVKYAEKPELEEIIEDPTDPTKIYNPRTKRWVLKTGKVGQQLLAGCYS